MAGPVLRGAFDKTIAPGALAAFADEYDSLEAFYPDFVGVESTERAFEEVIITTGLATTPQKPEGVEVAMDIPMQVGSVKMTVFGYGLGYEVSHEAMQDDLYGVITDPASRFLAQSMRDAEERSATGLYNLAFTTQQAYDGVSVINTAHPLKGGGTYANRPAAAQSLGFSSLQASLERFKLMVNERSLKIKVMPVTLAVPVQLEWLADEILLSSKKPFTADNTENVLSAGRVGLTRKSSPYFTSSTAWFTVADKSKFKARLYWREKPNMDNDYNKKARIASFFNFARWGVVVWDWRGIDGSTG